MAPRIGRPSWSLQPLSDWKVTEHPECTTLEFSEEGALQLSSATKRDGEIVYEEVLAYAESQNEGWGLSSSVKCGDFSGIVYHYKDGEHQWNRWFLWNERTLIFVTYNGSLEAQILEYGAVVKMLETLRTDAAA